MYLIKPAHTTDNEESKLFTMRRVINHNISIAEAPQDQLGKVVNDSDVNSRFMK